MPTHETSLEISRSIPPELEVGARISLKVKASCPDGCDLRGIPVQVMAADEVVAISETEDFALKAPEQVGEHSWTILFPKHETESVVHEESRVAISFITIPHTTSMAVWDVPSPVVMNRSFKVKVGVKCSAACAMAGQSVDVCDEAGCRLGLGRLGETPWPGTAALYVAEVELTAPATEAMNSWCARFAAASEPGLPHAEASAAFTFRTARPPEYRIIVRVTEKDTKAPLENVDVRLGVYRASTDAQGLATLELPAGTYDLDAWKTGYETLPRSVVVAGDETVQVEAVFSPEKDPDDSRVWM
jgi:hypothetical protein